jgi:hypothetical protein
MNTIHTRAEALAWWKGLSHQEAFGYFELWYYNSENESKRRWNFKMVCTSSSTIEFLYRMYVLDEDVKF